MRQRHLMFAIIVAAVLLLVSASLGAYLLRHGMAPVQGYERGQSSLPTHVLVATQGSTYKDRLVNTLVALLERRPAYVKVIDVAMLDEIDAADWQAIVIVHSWEFGLPPRAVSGFLARLADPGRIIDVTTSGSGREKLPGVDAISSASIVDDIPDQVMRIDSLIDALLARP